ncbi:hypothetical protein [Pseudomonas putida]|uniref:hypothetical protein n=1 Tax=Pseudomonas putida TaxID=303 RepID=UPI0009A20708|nr:hypothetical protein [Pseudomonas putida]
MYRFHVKWKTREQLPDIPPNMLFSGIHHDAPTPESVVAPTTPVITWEKNVACVFDDKDHHDVAWLVVYGGGVNLTGAQKLADFRHVVDIREAPTGVSMMLIDSSDRQFEVSHLSLDQLDGREGAAGPTEGLPTGIPFCLRNGHDYLVADEAGVRMAALADPLAMRWEYKNGTLTHVASRQVLGMGIRCKPVVLGSDKWHLSPRGALFYDNSTQSLCADGLNGDLWLQEQGAASPETQWQVVLPDVAVRERAAGMVVNKLVLRVQVANDYRAGTSDSVRFSINGSSHRQFLAGNFERGSVLQVEVDLSAMFPGRTIYADELQTVALYQESSHGYGPAWRMNALDLVVNELLSNRLLGSQGPWLLPGRGASWKGALNWLDWRREGQDGPLDFAGFTYPVQWKQMLGDWLAWRSYDPSSIEGICQLIGEQHGRILAYDLKHKCPIYLEPSSDADSYTWVYTPQGSIIVKWWDKVAPQSAYVRHSQLGGGQPVICAGEMKISRQAGQMAVQDLLGMINDASGHYQPDGGACLGHVLERLEQLGLDTSATQVHSRR